MPNTFDAPYNPITGGGYAPTQDQWLKTIASAMKTGSGGNYQVLQDTYTAGLASPAGSSNTGATDGSGGSTQPVDLTGGQSAAAMWNLENDPIYSMAIKQGQSAFNVARANALAGMQNQETALNRQTANIENSAVNARRQLAGNFAARGMQRGGYGAYYRAQDLANAEQVAKVTDIRDQIASLNQDFLGKYGAIGTDWTATGIGQDYKNQAIQQAIAAQLARYGTV